MIVLPLTLRPLLHVCAHMRPRDQREALVLTPDLSISEWAAQVLALPGDLLLFASDAGEPIAAGGWLQVQDPAIRETWLVATSAIDRIGISLHRFGTRFHQAMAEAGIKKFRTLGLDDGDTRAALWLSRLNYQPDKQTTFIGARGEKLAAWVRVEGGNSWVP